MTLLAAIHLVPLPAAVWHTLPGRDDVRAVDALLGLGDIWRPLTLTPMNGWHALVSLFTPLAVLLLGIQLSRTDLYRLLPLLIGLGALSGLFGLLQAIGSPEGPLYFYRITNNGAAVGLFANRNHAATLLACLFPMLAVFAATANGTADQQRRRLLAATALAIVLVPLTLVTGSRSGLACALLGMVGAALLYRRPATGHQQRRRREKMQIGMLPLLGGLSVACLAFLTIFFSRAEAIERLFVRASTEDSRGNFWPVSIDMFWQYFPWGSGSGSFVEAYQIAETSGLLDSTYLNHAHNDWLEIAVTLGMPGLLLTLVTTLFFLRRTFTLLRHSDGKRRSVVFARMACLCLALIAIASISDYPLRTPIIMSLFAVLALWFVEAGRGPFAAPQNSPAEN